MAIFITTPKKQKSRRGDARQRAVECFSYESSIQTGSGAAGSRDDGDVGAPRESFSPLTYRIAGLPRQSKLRFDCI
jgi:hypothetical protein